MKTATVLQTKNASPCISIFPAALLISQQKRLCTSRVSLSGGTRGSALGGWIGITILWAALAGACVCPVVSCGGNASLVLEANFRKNGRASTSWWYRQKVHCKREAGISVLLPFHCRYKL